MTQASNWDLGGESNSFSFDNVGDSVIGTVIDLTERQSTDMDSGQPAFWDNGDKKMLSVVTLQTDLRDPANAADDGKRTVALSGSKKPETKSRMAAVIAAVREATGGTALQRGGRLQLQYVGDGVATRRGFNAPKLYEAKYLAPAMDLAAPAATRPAAAPVNTFSGITDEPPF